MLNAGKFGLACGIVWALAVFLLGITAFYGWGAEMQKLIASLYLGYKAGLIGGLIGALWAFIDGFVVGYVLIWIYNKLNK